MDNTDEMQFFSNKYSKSPIYPWKTKCYSFCRKNTDIYS